MNRGASTSSAKRILDTDIAPASKKAKTSNNNPPKKSSLSSYLQQVSPVTDTPVVTERVPKKTDANSSVEVQSEQPTLPVVEPVNPPVQDDAPVRNDNEANIQAEETRKNVKWADMEGGPLYISHQPKQYPYNDDQDKRKRDRLREKELLKKAR